MDLPVEEKSSLNLPPTVGPPYHHSFNKQSKCAKVITKIIKEHFVEAHAIVRKIPDEDPGQTKEHVAKYQELKTNAKRLHIETSSPMPIDEQLMFEVASGSNKGHSDGEVAEAGHRFCWFLLRLHTSLCQEGEEVIGIHAVGRRQVRWF
ncbi:hypothetical protein M9H77_29785 [Catharanthus roseus]|uniref:Uncharacterized protein n=1 Tax=Catharanthus roseus TaxID=4058 RepID=A0ACB9ZZM6_CATRO|nr:hypothetical protein M9H77_29785 [Catharanthus roseus]